MNDGGENIFCSTGGGGGGVKGGCYPASVDKPKVEKGDASRGKGGKPKGKKMGRNQKKKGGPEVPQKKDHNGPGNSESGI